MRTTTTQRLFLPPVLVLTLLASSSSIIITTDARAVPIKRSPGTDDKGPVFIPPDHDYYPHTPCVWLDQCGGELPTNGGGGKRQKRSFEPQEQQAQEQPQIEKRSFFSRLLNTDRSHRPYHRTSSHQVHYQSYNNNDNDGTDKIEAEEYHYWNVEEQEEGEEEEGIDVEDDMERHGGIYEDVDDDDEDVGDNDGRAVLFGSASPSTIVRAAGANAPIVIEPFLHPTSLSSLIEDKETDGDQVQEKEEDNNTAAVAFAAVAGDNDDKDKDMDRIRASQPWYQHPEQYPSSSSASASSKHHNILSQIWIVDEWDEDFEGVEEETLDD